MKETQSWSRILIQQLIADGVRDFCISPGSRSTALTLAIAEAEEATSFVHFDERGMAFQALGFAKAVKRPVALVVTSGTAVGNLLPAVMEAYHTHVPLLILTADRPPELHETGANQTTYQQNIFTRFVTWETTLPCASDAFSEEYLRSTVAHAIACSRQGPVHLNCMLRKPFISSSLPIESATPIAPTTLISGESHFPCHMIEYWSHHLSAIEKGVILAGPDAGSPQFLLDLADALQWPLIADLQSGIRELGAPLLHTTLVLKQKPPPPQAVLHFGGALIANKVFDWISTSNKIPSLYVHISQYPERIDPLHRVTHRFSCSPTLFCKQLIKELPKRECSDWMTLWKKQSDRAQKSSHAFFAATQQLSEPGLIPFLNKNLTQNHSLFIGNSMPIRDADALLFPKQPIGPIFANRGLSGIDGNIATAIGVARGTKQCTVAVIGDTAFLHDLNSLAALRECQWPVLFLVINNQGGGIFSFLPVKDQTHHFERYWGCPHDYTFKKAAEMFGLDYHLPKNSPALKTLLQQSLAKGCSALIEVHTERGENHALHQLWTETFTQTTKELL